MYKPFCVIFLVISFEFVNAQNLSNSIVDTSLTESELSYTDSISRLNELNNILISSRNTYNIGLDQLVNEEYNRAILSFTKAILIDSTNSYFLQQKEKFSKWFIW